MSFINLHYVNYKKTTDYYIFTIVKIDKLFCKLSNYKSHLLILQLSKRGVYKIKVL